MCSRSSSTAALKEERPRWYKVREVMPVLTPERSKKVGRVMAVMGSLFLQARARQDLGAPEVVEGFPWVKNNQGYY